MFRQPALNVNQYFFSLSYRAKSVQSTPFEYKAPRGRQAIAASGKIIKEKYYATM